MYNQEAAKRVHIGGMQPTAQVGTMTTAGSAIAAALAVGSGSAMLEMGATALNTAQATTPDHANSTIAGRKRPNADQPEAQQGGSNSNSAGSGGAAAPAPPPPQQQLKCPRCESRNTKFCYYNNYSTSQPRHFCKNCRRYWTQGGALRNVPVGGGCRKNKRSSAAAAAATASAAAASSLMSKMHCRAGMQMDPMGHLQHPGGADPNSILSRLTSTFPSSLNDPEFLKVALSRFSPTPPGLLGGGDAGLLFDSPQIPGHFKAASLLGSRQVSPLTSFDANVQMDVNFLGASAGASPNMYHPADPRAAGLTPLQLYDNQPKLRGTSATATLASLEDQLSSFSNVTSINDSQLSSGQQQLSTKEQADIDNNHNQIPGVFHDQDEKLPLQLLGNNNSNHHNTDQGVGHPNLVPSGHFANDHAQAADQGAWMLQQQQQQQQQQGGSSLMGQEMIFENHHSAGLWGHSTRWQDMHPLASTTTALELH